MDSSESHCTDQPQIDANPPIQVTRKIWRYLYFPYTWFVFIPFLTVTTIFFGTTALLSCFISKRLAFHSGTLWSWLLCRMNFTWVTIKGRQNALKNQSYVIMSNHQSNFDILAFYGHWGRQFRWVMKKELRKVPGLGWGCNAVGHIFIDRSDRQKAIASLEAAKPLLAGGISVMFFPEGTRSNDGKLLPFKKGGFMMALNLGLPILPVTIDGSRHVLPNRTLKLLPGLVKITLHPPVDVKAYGPEKRDQLMEDIRRIIAPKN
jgi:1-acyl-sn-glycerol-3-phosphate acyltransferase